MMENNVKLNRLPVLTWNKLKVNECGLMLPADFKPLDTKITCEKADVRENIDFDDVCPTGTGRDTDYLFRKGISVDLGSGQDHAEAVFEGSDGLCSSHIDITVGENAELVLVERIGSGKCDSAVRTTAKVAENGRFTLVQIITGKKGSSSICDTAVSAEKNALVKLVRMYISKGSTFTGTNVDLNGKSSELESYAGYIVGSGEKLDMNLMANHIGRKTISNISADGSLYDGAEKVFRGTIDLRNGCAGAEGKEEETVLLLGDNVVNKTIPLILCSEEDVSGVHGATIGELSPEILLYFGSRGIGKDEAEKIMAKSHLERLASVVDEKTAEIIHQTLKEQFGLSAK